MVKEKIGASRKGQRRGAVFISALFTVILFVIIFSGCIPVTRPASYYTEEEHVQRVSERVEEKYIKTGKYDGFELFKLYDENAEFKYFLVEFEPTGFVYVEINANGGVSFGCATYGMYTQDRLSDDASEPWERYFFEDNIKVELEMDENGNCKTYTDSHFKAANIDEEKRYFLYVKQDRFPGYIPAVKRGDKYLNLVSMKEFEYVPNVCDDVYAIAIYPFIYSYQFDL